MRLLTIFMVLVLAVSILPKVTAQKIVFHNSKPVDTLRYQGIKGSVYLYDEWKSADILSRDGIAHKNVFLNYNGYEKKFEVTELNNTISLDVSTYDKIIVYLEGTDNGPKELFVKGVHYDVAMILANVIYSSDSIKLIRFFNVRVSETTNEIYGDNTVRRKFVQSRQYAVLYKSKLTTAKLSWYKLSIIFGNREMVVDIIKKNNIKLPKEKDLIRFMKIIDQQLK